MITDIASVRYCNEQLRPAFDELAGSVLKIQSLLTQWLAKNLAATISNTSDLIDDGAAPGGSAPGSPDGRTPITGADVNAAIGFMGQIQSALAANDNAMLDNLFKIAVNPL